MTQPGFNAYKTYLAIKRHFNSDYDFFKYRGKIKVSENSFLKRKDKYFFEKIERKFKKNLVPFFVSNILHKSNAWSGDLASEQAEDVYLEWKKKTQSIQYMFREDMNKILNLLDEKDVGFNQLFECENGEHPIIFKALVSEEISLESFLLLDKCINFVEVLNKKLDDFIWMEYHNKIMKYSDFIEVDEDIYKKILRDIFL